MAESELDRARRLATEMLMERLADDVLELEEFEARLDQVNAAGSIQAVADVLGDVAAARARKRLPDYRASSRSKALRDVALPALEPMKVPTGLRRIGRRNSVVMAFQDGSGRLGPWQPARHVWVVNMLGAAIMDFREASLPPGVTELTVFCIMGDVEVIVPLDLQVEFGGLGLIGGFDSEPTLGVSDPDAPVLRINGVSCLGGVSVAVRALGEPAPTSHGRRSAPKRIQTKAPSGGPSLPSPSKVGQGAERPPLPPRANTSLEQP